VNIHEYQAKAILRKHGVSVPQGDVASSPAEARDIARKLGGRVVVKAQIHAGAGGRGKGTFHDAAGKPVLRPQGDKPQGGVVVVDGPDAAEDVAKRMLGNVLVTKQSGAEGRVVRRVLIEEGMAIAKEYYLALLVDRTTSSPVFIASAEGGTEIEEIAATRPAALVRVSVDPRSGYSPYVGRSVAYGLGLAPEIASQAGKMVAALYETFVATDASLVEVNPLIVTADGKLVALDAKFNLDDSALQRHPDLRELRDQDEEDPLEVEAARHNLNYIKLDGIKLHGGSPANFLDVGGGATTEMVTAAFQILLKDPHVKAVLINIFGGIMRCDVVAEGVVAAAKKVGVAVPIVVRLEGTNVERGREILNGSGLAITSASGMQDAAEKVVSAARGR
jgi:succinyl-CoA synthetase beta subunit